MLGFHKCSTPNIVLLSIRKFGQPAALIRSIPDLSGSDRSIRIIVVTISKNTPEFVEVKVVVFKWHKPFVHSPHTGEGTVMTFTSVMTALLSLCKQL